MRDYINKNNWLIIPLSYVLGMLLLNIVSAIYLLNQGRDHFYINESIIVNMSFYVVMMITLISLAFTYLKAQIKDGKNRIKAVLAYIAIGFGTIFGTSMVVGLINQLLDVDQAVNQEVWEAIVASGTFGMVSTVVVSVLLAPVVEELVFRYAGFSIMRRFNLSEKLYPYVTIIVTSIMFGLIHVLGDDIIQILFYSALGGVLGFFYYKSKNIFVPITIHLIWNLLGVVMMIFA